MKINRKGFTLVELLAVIVILTILVLLAIPAVTRQVEYSRKKTFIEDANTAIEAARNDLFMSNKDLTEKKEFVYAFNDLNNLLEKKLVDSPFGGKYLDASVKVEMNKNSFGELDPVYYLCLIDESHNGFTYTEYGKMDIDTIVMGGIQDCNSEITTYVITADANSGLIPQTAGWKLAGATGNESSASLATKSISYGSPYGTLPIPVLEGSTFDGWYASLKSYKFTVALSGNTITVTVKDSDNNPIPNVTIEDIEWDVVEGTTNSNGVFTFTDNSAYEWFYEGRHLRITIDGSNYDIKDEATMGETEVVSTFQLYSSKVTSDTIMNKKADHRIYAKWK